MNMNDDYNNMESPDAIMLKEAEVTANAAKVQVKGDSLIYNADAYRMHEGRSPIAKPKRIASPHPPSISFFPQAPCDRKKSMPQA